MFLVDKPYISDFFKQTMMDSGIPVVATELSRQMDLYAGTNLISESRAIEMVQQNQSLPIYTTSENAISWITENLSFSDLPDKIALFKDKLKFRQLTQTIFPDFYFRGVNLNELQDLQFDQLPLPFIIKPSIGFMSMGVYKVANEKEWQAAKAAIVAEIDQVKGLYPDSVLDTNAFIIEQCIDGEEFAVDVYYNDAGEAVVLGILKHVFSSDADVSDRVYISSKEIVEENLTAFTRFADKIGRLAGVKNFPVHIELRKGRDGTVLPIEVNAMRFGGWCTTADLTAMAYGFNPYRYFYGQQKPDWSQLLQGKEGVLYSMVVLDNSSGFEIDAIASFDYEKLLTKFKHPLELRQIDFRQYPVFGFLLLETQEEDFAELQTILESDLREFITLK
ncbi:ATP-grasp domain-containing protein [Desulfuromusa kysingii]|uniref:ATP-grasp domain-containing protein n=1 Tax=Desulfuromusa kysingii TaxID=37625 RepID=A0A1H3XET8_9BACT|nr:ATP-grasp domain-containing protein [Desulfuromusa kysingii]SDZ97859.1 ATP-grasp domain-containing protein [Desulfuromusa kysingii]